MTRATIIDTYAPDGSFVRTEIPWTAADYAEWRRGLRAFRRAFRRAMARRPVSDVPALAAAIPGAANLRSAADAYAASLPDGHPVRDVWQDVQEFLRDHPDMTLFTAAPPAGFGVSDEWLDALFLSAMAAASGATDAEIDAVFLAEMGG